MKFYTKADVANYLETTKYGSIYGVITALLYHADSHCVGYRISVPTPKSHSDYGDEFDFLNIQLLKDCIKDGSLFLANLAKSTDILCENGHLSPLDWESLSQIECPDYQNEFERNGLNEGLISLLDMENKFPPKQFYEYVLNEYWGVYQCRLTDEATAYLQATTDDIIIPQPLYKHKGMRVLSCGGLFSELKLRGKQVDFSSVDLSHYQYIDNLFSSLDIDYLDVASFKLNPRCAVVDGLFENLNCDVLNLNDFKLSGVEHLNNCFNDVNIGKLQAKGCVLSNVQFHAITYSKELIQKEWSYPHIVFKNAKIDEFDLEFFSKISLEKHTYHTNRNRIDFGVPEIDFDRDNFKGPISLFRGLECKEFVNMDMLPLRQTTSFDMETETSVRGMFAGLSIDTLDLTDLCLDDVTDFTEMLAEISCKRLIIDIEVFSQAQKIDRLFLDSHLGNSDIDFSQIEFEDTCSKNDMFKDTTMFGCLTLPRGYEHNFYEEDIQKTMANEIYDAYGNLLAKSKRVKHTEGTMRGAMYTIMEKVYFDDIDTANCNF